MGSKIGKMKRQTTFRKHKHHKEGSLRHCLHLKAFETLGSGDIHRAVKLPEGEDINEWLAMNTVDFFNDINLIYNSIEPFCTDDVCPVMDAGPNYEYYWADGVRIKKPIKVSAPDYVAYLMVWIEDQIEDETIFASSLHNPFPPDFKNIVKRIFKRLFRVHAHIYHRHFKEIQKLDCEAHFNSSFKHFYLFVKEFDLINDEEMAPLKHIINDFIDDRKNIITINDLNNVNTWSQQQLLKAIEMDSKEEEGSKLVQRKKGSKTYMASIPRVDDDDYDDGTVNDGSKGNTCCTIL